MTNPEILELDERVQGSEVVVKPGQKFALSLAEDASTGFSWLVRGDALAWLLANDYQPGEARRPGAGGTCRLLFRAPESGSHAVDLLYRRILEPNKGRSFGFRLRVEP